MHSKIDVCGMETGEALEKLESVVKTDNLASLEIRCSTQAEVDALLKVLVMHGASCEVISDKSGQTITASFVGEKVLKHKSYVVGSDALGSGDEVLGRKLMTAFFNVNAEYDQVPASMFFMNTGAKLCIEGADTLAALKALEAKGTEIIVCGTCLNFFDITNKLAVGRVGSMHDFIAICHNQSDVVNL